MISTSIRLLAWSTRRQLAAVNPRLGVGQPSSYSCNISRRSTRQHIHFYTTTTAASDTTTTQPLPLISINSCLFYRHTPTTSTASTNPPLLPTPLTLAIPPSTAWCILSPRPSQTSLLLSLLSGHHLPSPPLGRTYPHLTQTLHTTPSQSIHTVEFGSSGKGLFGGSSSTTDGDGGGYISARYESLRVVGEDVLLREWLVTGGMVNVLEEEGEEGIVAGGVYGDGKGTSVDGAKKKKQERFDKIVKLLRLDENGLLDQPIMTLSNGQSRRARIARALLKNPALLLLEEPFMGLDPPSARMLGGVLGGLKSEGVGCVVALRRKERVPAWVDGVIIAEEDGRVVACGGREEVNEICAEKGVAVEFEERGERGKELGRGLFQRVWGGVDEHGVRQNGTSTGNSESHLATELTPTTPSTPPAHTTTPIVQMVNVNITYNLSSSSATASTPPRPLLSSFTWTINPSERWGVFGPNGSGKTTLLALLTSDHPQTYSQHISHFGKLRSLPGTPIWEIQARIGQSSPEIHAFFPRHLRLRRVIESAWADTPLSIPPEGKVVHHKVDRILEYFSADIPRGWWEEDNRTTFGELTMGEQRLVLFMRAVVKNPELVILDEPFSGMSEGMRERCLGWLEKSEGLEARQALVVVSHVEEEVPRGVDKWVRLAGAGRPAEFGVV